MPCIRGTGEMLPDLHPAIIKGIVEIGPGISPCGCAAIENNKPGDGQLDFALRPGSLAQQCQLPKTSIRHQLRALHDYQRLRTQHLN